MIDIISISLISLNTVVVVYLVSKLNNIGDKLNHFQIDNKAQSNDLKQTINNSFSNILELLKSQLDSISKNLQLFLASNDSKLEALRTSVEDRLYKIQADNNEKLEKMRITVEEKLHETLDKRLASSFKMVTEQLEIVHRGLGEMQTLAHGVGDLKRVLANVKTRGIWGEIQLEAILEQILAPAQYSKSAEFKKRGSKSDLKVTTMRRY